MKKLALSLSLVFALLLAACGGGGNGATGTGSTADYAQLITENRTEDENTTLPIITSPDDKDFSMIFELYGFVAEDMERFAVSISMMNVKAYGVAIVLPAEGRTDAVKAQMEAFIEFQQKSQENYLPDQYEIAKGALLETADTGEVVMVMCEDAATMMAALKAGLAG